MGFLKKKANLSKSGRKIFKMPVSKLRIDGVSTDGTASNSAENGFLEKLKDDLPHLLNLICCAHTANLPIKELLKENAHVNLIVSNTFKTGRPSAWRMLKFCSDKIQTTRRFFSKTLIWRPNRQSRGHQITAF